LQKETYKDVIPSFNGNCFTRQTKHLCSDPFFV
jgi:hypothetical protein